jgi:hypothetical protein
MGVAPSRVAALVSLLGLLAAHDAGAQVPPAVLRAAGAACASADAATSTAGPWRRGDAAYSAAVFWREGAAQACLVMLVQREGAVSVVARGAIDAGWSERYGERYAPGLRADPVWLPALPPSPVTDTAQMGAGGGGGSLTTLWVARRGRWDVAFARTLDGAMNINTAVETPCDSARSLVFEAPRLTFDECFDGRTVTRSLRFDGRRFVPGG